jgi:hypothetical protein
MARLWFRLDCIPLLLLPVGLLYSVLSIEEEVSCDSRGMPVTQHDRVLP